MVAHVRTFGLLELGVDANRHWLQGFNESLTPASLFRVNDLLKPVNADWRQLQEPKNMHKISALVILNVLKI